MGLDGVGLGGGDGTSKVGAGTRCGGSGEKYDEQAGGQEYEKGDWGMDGRMVGKTSGRLVVDGFFNLPMCGEHPSPIHDPPTHTQLPHGAIRWLHKRRTKRTKFRSDR